MQIKEKFSAILNYVIGKKSFHEECKDNQLDAILILANKTAEKMVDVLEDDSPRDVMDFFYSLQELSDTGKPHVAKEIIVALLSMKEQEELSMLIKGFISQVQLDSIFVTEFVDAGADCCFFKSIGLE